MHNFFQNNQYLGSYYFTRSADDPAYIYHPPSDMKIPSARKYKCKLCEKNFAYLADLKKHGFRNHYEAHLFNSNRPFKKIDQPN